MIFIKIIAIFILALVIFYKFWFLRNPKFTVPKGNNLISPAQGRISKIIEIKGGSKNNIEKGKGRIGIWADNLEGKDGYLISIVMTPFDMHFQKAPIAGTITKVQHTKGKHKNALSKKLRPEDYAENEHREFTIEGKNLKIKIIQIAGFLARRTVSLVHESQKVAKGQDIGLIRFGSQVTLIIPKLPLKIKVGDKVKAGRTIIALNP
ncbi:MAG: hypothetical protein ACD_65C00094G0002 [uncultured bacterium]|nr:MAG: hypothetical protein ACD_65C00094G0002 [uncultured bacterium]KKT02441.1 MAG: phosphatidylserine decarboxylase, phosphatidylserine decarboxylase [Candidatus Peregrinibacteria bacterium GW2011_GWF2_43_17]KKT19328.1 MAG: Phosphatidylserine decarboxylase proenzyme [Candidatus Peregrinibacteria bacterium GW2011_GWA2_43_8]HAU40163.1 phosphatidylserine decarboxylase family protein [Candidatus Peregrinibacteria bacterium]